MVAVDDKLMRRRKHGAAYGPQDGSFETGVWGAKRPVSCQKTGCCGRLMQE